MSVTTNAIDDGKTVEIKIDGRFDFSLHRDFRNAYSDLDSKPDKFVVNLSGTQYMDSSALGMLLLLREQAGGNGAKIDIVNAHADIKKILAISNFDKLFNIV